LDGRFTRQPAIIAANAATSAIAKRDGYKLTPS
jgi:hypothetical protein